MAGCLFQPLFVGFSVTQMETISSLTFTNTTNNRANYTLVNIYPFHLTGYTKFRVKIKNGGDSSATITKVCLGELAGTYGFNATPGTFTFDGSTSYTFNSTYNEAVSDILSFTPAGGKAAVIAFHLDSNNSEMQIRDSNPTGWAHYAKSGADDSATVSKTGYSAQGIRRTALVFSIEGGA